MESTDITYSQATPIDSYGPGYFRIAGQSISGATLVLPTRAVAWGGYSDSKSILANSADYDVLFVGTGAEMAHLPVEFRTLLEKAGIGVEPMASPSACRLYNILVSEGRRIACALLPV